MVTIVKQFRCRFRRSFWDGDLLENCAKNASVLRGKREKNQKNDIQKNAFFVRNGVVFFLAFSPTKSIFFVSSNLKKKRHQIDIFSFGIDAVGREKTKHAKLSNSKRVFFGMVTITKQTYLNLRRLVWGGDLLENCEKNANKLRAKREKMKK